MNNNFKEDQLVLLSDNKVHWKLDIFDHEEDGLYYGKNISLGKKYCHPYNNIVKTYEISDIPVFVSNNEYYWIKSKFCWYSQGQGLYFVRTEKSDVLKGYKYCIYHD